MKRLPHKRISADQRSPAREACLLTRWGRWGLEAEALSLEADPRERTGVGCMNTASRGLVHPS